jgi:putative proteasome-type protease
MDSTLKSNISVGLPLDLLIYERDSLAISQFVTITAENPYFNHIRGIWGQQLRSVFNELPDPDWSQMPTVSIARAFDC